MAPGKSPQRILIDIEDSQIESRFHLVLEYKAWRDLSRMKCAGDLFPSHLKAEWWTKVAHLRHETSRKYWKRQWFQVWYIDQIKTIVGRRW